MADILAARRMAPGHLGRAVRQPITVAGLVLVVLLLGLGVLAPVIAGDPLAQGPDALAGPGARHWLGTDEFGRDLFARVLYGLRQDAVVAGLAVPAAAALGTALGLLSGLANWLDV